jgi:hypothetical protein
MPPRLADRGVTVPRITGTGAAMIDVLTSGALHSCAMPAVTSGIAVADVERIAAMEDRVVRNLQITQCYCELSEAMRARLGGAADWCAFATWASRQAGSTIRGEDLLDRIERRLGDGSVLLEPVQSINRYLLRKGLFEPRTRLGRTAAEIHTPFDAVERASANVAEGNRKVFEEIGREFARFLAVVPPQAAPGSDAIRAFAAGLRVGQPPDGQDLLREAFTFYQHAALETDPPSRAGWTLLANLKIGQHEQTRLQPQIAAAVDAPFVTTEDLGSRVLHALIPSSRRWLRLLHRPAASALGWLAQGVRAASVRLTREAVTEALMVLTLPGGVLRLGRNLDAPVPTVFTGTLPPPLSAFIREFDPCGPGVSDCGAHNWCNFGERMHYILHLFRAYAADSALFAPPFSSEQVTAFRAGIVPSGDL